jgi:hypothetical protein
VGVLPQGFSDLVALVLEDWDWDVLPEEDGDIWDALISTVFLGATVRTAQAGYIKEVLGDFLEFDAAKAVPTDPVWSKKVLKAIDAELGSIGGTLGEGFKRAILQIATRDVKSLDLSRTIGTALKFLDDYSINVQKIKSLENDYKGTLELVHLAARDIHKVRYIKGVLWFYGCGIAKELVPPNAHVTRFLNECGYPGFGWSREGQADSQILAPVCHYMQEVANQVGAKKKRTITPKQAQAAVWYLQTCRGLLPRGYKNRLTPLLLIDFLDIQKWDIQQLDQRIVDVEQLEDLIADLKSFLSSL